MSDCVEKELDPTFECFRPVVTGKYKQDKVRNLLNWSEGDQILRFVKDIEAKSTRDVAYFTRSEVPEIDDSIFVKVLVAIYRFCRDLSGEYEVFFPAVRRRDREKRKLYAKVQ